MKPVKLEFEGINSFSEHTIIDFERLTSSGIFGIFGDTGSGKSTILDCINFALYGKVERSKEKTDIINYKCGSASVKYTFTLINGGTRKTYFIERTIKRDKNSTHKASLYENGVCLAEKAQDVERKVVEILGVEAEDFRKCIALPQGEFSQFVKSAPRDRLALIERLFSLSKYGDGLKAKIAAAEESAESEFQNFSGRLSAYAEYDEELKKSLEKRLKEEKTRAKELNKQSKTAAEKYSALKTLLEKSEELKSCNDKLDELYSRRAEMEELRKGLSLLPLCRQAEDYGNTLREAQDRISEAEKQACEITAVCQKLENELKECEKRISLGNFDECIEKLTQISAKYDSCEGYAEKSENIDIQLENKRKEYKNAQEKLNELIKEIDELEAQYDRVEKNTSATHKNALSELINVKFKGAVLRSEYVAMLDYFSEFKCQTEKLAEKSPLYEYVHGELKNQVDIYKERVLAVKDFKLGGEKDQAEALKKAIEERESALKEQSELKVKISDLLGKKTLVSRDIKNIENEGKNLKDIQNELKEKLAAAYGKECTDYRAAEKKNDEKLKGLKEERKELNEKREEINGQLVSKKLEAEKVKAVLDAEKKKAEEAEKKLRELIERNNLGSEEKCRQFAKKFSDMPDAEKSLKEYDSDLAALTAKRAELQKAEGVESVTREAVLSAEDDKEKIESEAEEASKAAAVIEAKLSDTNQKLKEKSEISAGYLKAEKRKNLVEKLKDLTRGNRFLEYIANEYLFEISVMASSTLLKLTDGRYFLTYKDNNFNVGDNFDCGSLRGVNTLSGGETFLVSLSLALALSQTICSRSMKSIEFFFLDEGFGTLDSALVDTVMSALEKLKSDSFTIGVISHVEELKHRIDNKITVYKATESHGSTVQLSF